MNKNLVTFGDSWPGGAELQNRTRAFGYLIAGMLNVERYENRAILGSSNDRMILQLQKYIQDHKTVTDHIAIFFITSPSRYLHLDKDTIREIKVPPDWRSESDPFISNWYRYYHNTETDNFNLYKVLLALQRICHQYQLQDFYLSGWTDINFDMPGVDTKKIFPTTCIELFGGNNALEFHDVTKNQYIYPNQSHPNVMGHELIAKTVYNWLVGYV